MASSAAPLAIEKITFVLWVVDMDRAWTFYEGLFGLTAGIRSPQWSELRFKDTVVALHAGGTGISTATGLSFQVGDLDEACARLSSLGGRIVEPPHRREGEPISLARVADTESNEFMLTCVHGD